MRSAPEARLLYNDFRILEVGVAGQTHALAERAPIPGLKLDKKITSGLPHLPKSTSEQRSLAGGRGLFCHRRGEPARG